MVCSVARTLLCVGARNLGSAICQHFAERGWNVCAVSQTTETADKLAERLPQALSLTADASQPGQLDSAIGATRQHFGSVELMVNAASPQTRIPGPFGGGPLADAGVEAFERYCEQVARLCFVFLSRGANALRQSGGTLVQITGGSARRAMVGRGAWAAGAFATRALTQAAALELREEGVHAACLIVDATIERGPAGQSDSLTTPWEVAAAVDFLASQSPRAWTHELQVTPSGDRFVP